MTESLHIVCPHCLARNRVPADRLADGARCGKCRTALFSAKPVNVDATALQRMLNGNDIPVVVDFWAPWCGPCKMFAPVYQQAAGRLEPRVRLLKCDTQAQPEAGARYGIRSIPTLAVFHHGRELGRQAGAMPLAAFLQWIETQLKPVAAE